MTRTEYLHEICKIVKKAIEIIGLEEASSYIDGSDILDELPWAQPISSRRIYTTDVCLEILNISPNWGAYLKNYSQYKSDIYNIENFPEMLESMACAAVSADAEGLFKTLYKIVKEKMEVLAKENIDDNITLAQAKFERAIIEAENKAQLAAEAEANITPCKGCGTTNKPPDDLYCDNCEEMAEEVRNEEEAPDPEPEEELDEEAGVAFNKAMEKND